MGNPIAKSSAAFIALGTNMDKGLLDLGELLGIKQITETEFKTDLDGYITADGAYINARSATQDASNAFQEKLDELSTLLQKTRNVLAASFGSTYSTVWAQAGFINASTQVPKRIDDKLGLAVSLVSFLGTHPTYEQPTLGVTKAGIEASRTATVTAQQAYGTAQITQKDKSRARDTAYETLATDMRTVIKNLSEILEANDPRWLAFGLNMPGADVTPSQPINVTATVDASGNIVVTCDPVALATRYRARMLRVGVDPDYRLAASGPAAMLVIGGVLPGQTVQIVMQAVNGSTQSVTSQPVLVTMPLPPVKAEERRQSAPATAKAAEAPVLPDVTLSLPATNGSRNGHADLTSVRSE